MDILEKYEEIMHNEAVFRAARTDDPCDHYLPLERPAMMRDITLRIMEVAKSSTVLRSGNITGKLTKSCIAFESDGAHTNLVQALVKCALDSRYGWGVSPPNYDRTEIHEAIMIHDLPENETGDIPDNRTRDETEKVKVEKAYIDKYLAKYSLAHHTHCWNIKKILREMQDKSSIEGRTLYVADKAAAIIMMLYYDKMGLRPRVSPTDDVLAKINQTEIDICNREPGGKILLSELWTVDFLYGREIVNYDDTGFFLAILVMMTLLVHGKWYDWREAQYLQ